MHRTVTSSHLGGPDLADRYAVLLDLARALGSSLVPVELHDAVYRHVQRVLPMSAFAVGEPDPDRGLHPVYDDGRLRHRIEFSADDLNRLQAGDYVLQRARKGDLSLLAAPLLRESRLLGCLVCIRHRGEDFDAEDAHFLLAVGRLAGVALDNAGLFERLQRRGREAERLESIARDLSTSLDPNAVADRIAEHAHALSDSPAVLWLRDADRLRALARAGDASVQLGDDRALPASLATSFTDEPAGIARALVGVDEPAPAVRREPGAEAERQRPEAAAPIGVDGGDLMIPLAMGDRLIGAIGIETDDELGADRVRVLRRMAAFAASALENARLHAEVRRLSLTDPLVQLPNRRQLDLFLQKEFEAARRGRNLCFVLYDLDHFKDYNDTQGHRAGDIALIRFADVLRHETRAMNLAARYGGEEFATVLPDTGRAGGQAHAERVRRRAEQLFGGRLTVSAGVAEYSPDMKSPIELVVAADDALYRAKTDGRNRVHVAGE